MKRGEYLSFCGILLAWAGLAAGATLYVGGGGTYTSIQAAIDDAAVVNDEIEVAPGTYSGPGDPSEDSAFIDFKGKAIRLYSRDGAAVTRIDGSRYQHAVRCVSGEGLDSVLEGFTITLGGWGEYPSGGGMYNWDSRPMVVNCILWGNTGDQITGDPGAVTYSDVQGGWPGVGNIDVDPEFAGTGDYRLGPDSPCIDAGTNSPAGGLTDTDLEGNPRLIDGDSNGEAIVDMGAYEASGADVEERLRDFWQDLRDLGLPQGIGKSLQSKLDCVMKTITDGNPKDDLAAGAVLRSFLQEVRAQRGKHIPEPIADTLIARAEQISVLLADR